MPPKRHLLLTGSPGCGKTTVMRKLAAQLAGERPSGFYAEEIRAGELLAGSGPVVATVAQRGAGFIDEVKRREDCLGGN